MVQIPGIYVAIKGDFTSLNSEVNKARDMVTRESHRMADALAGAFSPGKIQTSIKGLITQLNTLNANSKLTADSFKGIGVSLGDLQKVTGISVNQFADLQRRFLETRAAKNQEDALKRISQQARLSRTEVAALGQQMNLSDAQIERVTTSLFKVNSELQTLSQRSKAAVASSFQGTLGSFATDVTTLASGGRIADTVFKSMSADLAVLGKESKLTSVEFARLQQQLVSTQAAKAQEAALLNIAKAAGLTEREMRSLGQQMGLSRVSVDDAVKSLRGVGDAALSTTDKMKTMITTVALYSVAFQAVSRVTQAVTDEFKLGFSSIEEFRLGVAASAAYITSFSEKSASGDLSGAYKDAAAYAEKLAEKLEMVDAQTIATGKDLQLMSETFIKHGVLLDINNKKQVDGFTNIATAVKLVTKGQEGERQIIQEINALMNGTARTTDQLAMFLKAQDPLIKQHLALWQREGTLIENVGKLLEGFSANASDLNNLWITVGSTMETINRRILRGAFEPAFKDLIDLAKSLNSSLSDANGNLTPLAEGIQRDIRDAYQTGKELVDKYGESVVRLAGVLVAAKTAQIALNVAVGVNPYVLAAVAIVHFIDKVDEYKKSIEGALSVTDTFAQSVRGLAAVLRGDIGIGQYITANEAELKSLLQRQAGTAELTDKIEDLNTSLKDARQGFDFTSEERKAKEQRIEAIKEQIGALEKQRQAVINANISGVVPITSTSSPDPSKFGGALPIPVPKLVKRAAETDEKALRRAVDLREKLAEVEKSANALAISDARNTRRIELQIIENSYDSKIISLSEYLKKKQAMELATAEEEVRINRETVASFETVLAGQFSSGTRGLIERAEATVKLNKAVEKLRDSEASLQITRLKATGETAAYRREEEDFVRSTQIRYNEYSGSFEKAEQLRQQSIEYTTELWRLQQDAIEGVAGAQEALANFKSLGAADLRSARTRDERTQRDVTLSKFGSDNEFDDVVRKYQDMYDRIRDIEDQFGVNSLEAHNLRLGSMVDMTRDAFSTIADVLMSGNRQQFEAGKAIAMAMAVVNGALAVTKAMTTTAPPMSFVLAGLVGAAVGVQLAKISSTQYQGRAKGGPVYAGQTYIVNENRKTEGPEYFTPSMNGTITPAPKMRGGGTVNQTINVMGSMDRRTATQVSRESARKQQIAQLRFGT